MRTLGDIYKEAMFRGAQGGFAAAGPMPMAEGGIVDEPTEAVVGEAGAEAVIPLEEHQGQSCDEAHPDQSHEEWAEGRRAAAEDMLETPQEKEAMDKLAAEQDAAGRIMARGFLNEIEKVALHPLLASAGRVGKGLGVVGLGGVLGLGGLAGAQALSGNSVWEPPGRLDPYQMGQNVRGIGRRIESGWDDARAGLGGDPRPGTLGALAPQLQRALSGEE